MLTPIFSKLEKLLPAKWRWVLSHEGFKRYLANTGWMFAGQMFSLLVAFFVGAWIARYLGPENYGVLSYAVAFVGIFGFIATLGVDAILSRELIRFPEKRETLLGTGFRLKLIGGAIAFLLSIAGALIFETSPLIRLLIALFSLAFILQSANIISLYFQAEVKSKNNVKALIVATIISSLLKIGVILLNKGVIWLMVVYVLDSLWQGIGFWLAYKRHGLHTKDWRFDKKLAREILKDSWPLMLASGAGFIYLKIDQVMIGAFLSTRAVGLYAAAVKLVEVWYFIPVILCTSLYPAIINAKKISLELYHRRLKNFYVLMGLIPLIIALPLALLARPLILFLFGVNYLGSIGVLQIYIWSSLGLFLGWAVNQYLTSENLVKTIFWLNFLAMVINVALNFYLIPRYGIIGAAWATLISYLAVPAAVWLGGEKWRRVG